MSRVIGVDIGGTFTDLMLFDAEAGFASSAPWRRSPPRM
jgi:N-methylhydantoinase A/oxoprolinase/acetone carboxylase beta subunit